MASYAISIRFLGTNYAGWQAQDNSPSIQRTVQDAVEKTFGSRLGVSGCSRTDSGVHAAEYVFHIRDAHPIPAERIPIALNAHLPDDISSFAAREVDDDFHARYSCVGKEYVYKILNSRIRNPFLSQTTWLYPHKIDEVKANEFAQEFVGRQDFRSYMCVRSSITDTVRTVKYASVERDGDMIYFKVAADGFLYNMVRIMAGTLIGAVSGRFDSIERVTAAKDRSAAGVTLPAHGLWLNKVFY